MDGHVWLLTLVAFLMEKFGKTAAIHCFQCYSLEGNQRDCEDQFGPYNETGYLLDRDCVVGAGKYKAFHCVKIKGVKKDDGNHIVIRTCSVENWGSICGDIHLEQTEKTEPITGCLESCHFDGCNGASGHVTTRSLIFACAVAHLTWTLWRGGMPS